MAQGVRAVPITRSTAVTTSDTVLQNNGKGFSGGLWVGTGGVLVGRLMQDTADVTWTVAAGYVPGHWKLIKATGTTATGIIGLDDLFEGQWVP